MLINNRNEQPALINSHIFSWLNEDYKIPYVAREYARCSYIEAESNNWPLWIPCGFYMTRRESEGTGKALNNILISPEERGPTFLLRSWYTAYERQEIIFRTTISFRLLPIFPVLPLSSSISSLINPLGLE